MPASPLLLQALNGEAERPPVWLMRQAGRYMAEYRALKEKHSFLELCRTPELALEVSMQPVHALDIDAAIIFSDILIPTQALGINVDFNPGPQILNPLNTPEEIGALSISDIHDSVPFVADAIRLLRSELETLAGDEPRKAVIGFAGAPWTLACYTLNQDVYKHFHGTLVFARRHPKALKSYLAMLAEMTADYLEMQIEAGADAVQLFDSWGGMLALDDYREFALPAVQTIAERISARGVPLILYINGSGHLLEAMKESGATCASVDWQTDLAHARKVLGPTMAIQGNLDPSELFAPDVAERTKAMLREVQGDSRFIANLGHGVLQKTPVENVKTFVETVQAGWNATS